MNIYTYIYIYIYEQPSQIQGLPDVLPSPTFELNVRIHPKTLFEIWLNA